MIEFKNVTPDYFSEAITLATADYEAACASFSALSKANAEDNVERLLATLFKNGLGKIAVKNGKLIGYMTFFGPFEGFHGNVTGAFSPLGGNAFAPKDDSGISREKLASMLLAATAQDFIEKGIFQMALSNYAHDTEVGRSFILNGFGIRCSDSILPLDSFNSLLMESASNTTPAVCIREVPLKDRLQLLPLKQGLIMHLSKAPAFFPTFLSYDRVEGQLTDPDIRFFAAYKDTRPIGYIAVDSEGENFICNTPQTANICGAYVEKEYRGCQVAQQILAHICNVYQKEGYTLLGEDCETLNPTALRFWGKYFTPYTYSYIRRFDERVAGYEQYYNDYFSG